MIDTVTKPKTRVKTKTERPRLHKVILVNDDFTPREFVVTVLKAEFRRRNSDRVPDAVQRSSRCSAEPGPTTTPHGPRISSAPRRKCGALRSIRGTGGRYSRRLQLSGVSSASP